MIFTDDVERLVYLGGRDDLGVVLFHLYRQALRDGLVTRDDITDTVLNLVGDLADEVTDPAGGAGATL